MAMFAERMVEDGVIKIGGAELGRAISKVVPPVDCNLWNVFFRLQTDSTKGSLGRVHIADDEMEVKRKMRGKGVGRALVWVWLCEKDNSAFPQRFHPLTTQAKPQPTLNKSCSATRMPPDPLMGPLTCKSLVSSRCCHCSVSFYGTTAFIHRFNSAANPPRRRGVHEEPSNISFLCSSATADMIAWRSLPDLPLESERNPMIAFVNMSRYKQSGQSLGFKAGAKSQVMGFIATIFERISSE